MYIAVAVKAPSCQEPQNQKKKTYKNQPTNQSTIHVYLSPQISTQRNTAQFNVTQYKTNLLKKK